MILKTERLTITEVTSSEASFYFELFSDKDFIRFINDKNLKTVAETKTYLQTTLIPQFNINGLGFFTVSITETREKIGLSTLLKRDNLTVNDVGYAFLPKGRGKGFAAEATLAMMNYAHKELKQKEILAITMPGNLKSQRLLERIGFHYVKLIKVFSNEADCLYTYVF